MNLESWRRENQKFIYWLPVLRVALETQTQILQHRSKCWWGEWHMAGLCQCLHHSGRKGRGRDEMRERRDKEERTMCAAFQRADLLFSLKRSQHFLFLWPHSKMQNSLTNQGCLDPFPWGSNQLIDHKETKHLTNSWHITNIMLSTFKLTKTFRLYFC